MKKNIRRAVAGGVLGLTLAGCVPQPPGAYPPQAPSYPPPSYAPPPSGAYPLQAPYDPPPTSYAPPPDYMDEQYVYTDGTPYAVVGGQQYGVVLDPGLGWGYYDGYRRWHSAPPRWRDDFERRYPGGRGYAPGPPRESNFRPGAPPPGRPWGSPQGFSRPENPPPGRPGGAPQGFSRPENPPPGRRGGPPQGFNRPENPPPGRQGGQPAAFARPAGPPPADAPRPSAPPRQPEPRHEQRPACGAPGTPRC